MEGDGTMHRVEWNVWVYNSNRKKIEPFNIFNHAGFRNDITTMAAKETDYYKFAESVKVSLMYFFWCRAEWEICLEPWVGRDSDKQNMRIDVYDQVLLNWESFIDYTWDHIEEIIDGE